MNPSPRRAARRRLVELVTGGTKTRPRRTSAAQSLLSRAEQRWEEERCLRERVLSQEEAISEGWVSEFLTLFIRNIVFRRPKSTCCLFHRTQRQSIGVMSFQTVNSHRFGVHTQNWPHFGTARLARRLRNGEIRPRSGLRNATVRNGAYMYDTVSTHR